MNHNANETDKNAPDVVKCVFLNLFLIKKVIYFVIVYQTYPIIEWEAMETRTAL